MLQRIDLSMTWVIRRGGDGRGVHGKWEGEQAECGDEMLGECMNPFSWSTPV